MVVWDFWTINGSAFYILGLLSPPVTFETTKDIELGDRRIYCLFKRVCVLFLWPMAPPGGEIPNFKKSSNWKATTQSDHGPPKKNHSQNKEWSLGFSKTPFEKTKTFPNPQNCTNPTSFGPYLKWSFEASTFYPICHNEIHCTHMLGGPMFWRNSWNQNSRIPDFFESKDCFATKRIHPWKSQWPLLVAGFMKHHCSIVWVYQFYHDPKGVSSTMFLRNGAGGTYFPKECQITKALIFIDDSWIQDSFSTSNTKS